MFETGFPREWSTLRKLMLLNALAGGSGSTVLTVTGVSPLSLVNAVARSIVSLTQTGKCEQRNLPAAYTELEYLQSSGTQYINTGLDDTDIDEFSITFDAVYTAYGPIFGNYAAADNNAVRLIFTSSNNNSLYVTLGGRAGNSVPTPLTFVSGRMNTLRSWNDGTTFYIDLNGSTKTSGTTAGTANGKVIQLFSDGGGRLGSNVKIKSVTFKKNGAVVQNLVAAKNASNVLGFYDTVNGSFLTNAGTGTFTAGAAVVPAASSPVDIKCNNGTIKARRQSGIPPRYQMVEYLISTKGISIGIKTRYTFEIQTEIWSPSDNPAAQNIYVSDTDASGTSNTSSYTGASAMYWRFGSEAVNILTPTGDVTTKQNKDGVWFNGEKIASYTDVNTFTSTNDLNIHGGAENANMRVKWLKAWDNGSLVRDMVPVLDIVNNAYGWYDKKNGQFYTNAEATITSGAQVSDPIEMYADGTPEVITVTHPDSSTQTAGAENLFAVGDTKDEQDLISGVVTRRCAVCLYDGTQPVGDTYLSTTGGKDNGAIIVYPLAEPTTETVTRQILSTAQGTNTVTAVTNVDPVTLKAEYKGISA